MGVHRDARDVLRDAVRMELEGMEFFERASRRMTHERSKEMFLGLVAQERRHIEVLSHELRLLEEGREWATLDDAMRFSGALAASVFSGSNIAKLGLRPEAGELEVVDVGIEVEKRSMEFYRAAGAEAESQSAKQVFDWLVGEESGHLTILQAERDSRAGSGFHYDSMEFSLETE